MRVYQFRHIGTYSCQFVGSQESNRPAVTPSRQLGLFQSLARRRRAKAGVKDGID
jgi:hypothetical protein